MNPTLQCEETKKLLNQGAFLVDVRSVEEFQAGALKGAINLPLQVIPTAHNLMKEDAEIIVYCGTGQRSMQAATLLKQVGFDKVHNLGSYQNIQYC